MLTKEDIEAIRAVMNEELAPIRKQLAEMDISIGMLADWADSVATVTKIPFASGQTSTKQRRTTV